MNRRSEPVARVEYDRIASTFDERYRRNRYEGVEQSLAEFVDATPGPRVLEVGCGTGVWLEYLARRHARVAGLEPSKEMLARARARVPDAELIEGTAERLPWPDASFDRVIAVNAFHHFDRKIEFIRQARRVLVPGGRLRIIGLDPHTGRDRWWVYDYFEGSLAADRQRYPAAGTIEAWMKAAGFAACETREAQHFPLRFDAITALADGSVGKETTSQLAILPDDEYASGIEKIRCAIDAHDARGERLELVAELRLFAVTGTARD